MFSQNVSDLRPYVDAFLDIFWIEKLGIEVVSARVAEALSQSIGDLPGLIIASQPILGELAPQVLCDLVGAYFWQSHFLMLSHIYLSCR